MTYKEFCSCHWEYYLILEKDFLETERYLSFELGDNYLYDNLTPLHIANSLAFSVEFIKQYQSICSEIDVILQAICKEIKNVFDGNMKTLYTKVILNTPVWKDIIKQKVKMKDIELQPFRNWSEEPYKAPDWWPLYNGVKHNRLMNFKDANLKNVLNALAGLYVLENYFVKFIGDRENSYDVPNDISHLFEMVNWKTRDEVFGKDMYFGADEDVENMFLQEQ